MLYVASFVRLIFNTFLGLIQNSQPYLQEMKMLLIQSIL